MMTKQAQTRQTCNKQAKTSTQGGDGRAGANKVDMQQVDRNRQWKCFNSKEKKLILGTLNDTKTHKIAKKQKTLLQSLEIEI
jgi:hypothetical protein